MTIRTLFAYLTPINVMFAWAPMGEEDGTLATPRTII